MISSSKRIRTLAAVLVAAFIALSCAISPKPNATTNAEPQPGGYPTKPPANPGQTGSENFDPAMVTEAVKSATFVDVRALIESLNQIIRRQDYDAWRSHLTDEYIRVNSDPTVLAKYSEYPIIKRKGISLLTLKDYFINVVYPSRQNDKVDDIDFVGENQIKAITVTPKGDRNILYTLEKNGDAWKIGIGR
jgi:hypothetical protein